MKILSSSNINYKYKYNMNPICENKSQTDKSTIPVHKEQPSFKGNIFSDFINYTRAKVYSDKLYEYVNNHEGTDNFVLKNYRLEPLDGIQTGIKVFKGLTIKEIQYMSDNLHVIAVKRGCKNMCGYCYADAKPSNREMSYEDFHSIMDGYKKLRKRMHNLDLFSTNLREKTETGNIYKTTELFYDADCMDIAIKDKKGKEYDFIALSDELYDSLGRTTVFDTSGWHINNKKMQERAVKYAKHFSDPKNMEKLEAFNISFNVFNASYIASQKALKNGDIEKANRLRERFTTNMANTLFTFTPLLQHPKFIIMCRAFNSQSTKNSKGYNEQDMYGLICEVKNKLKTMYKEDLAGKQTHVKSQADISKYMDIVSDKMLAIDVSLNSAGRMQKFVKDNKIKAKNLQNHNETTPKIEAMLKDSPRMADINCIMHRLIDTDGKVYHMDYARFFPTEIQLNISGKNTPTPKLANLVEDFIITKDKINLI